MKSNVNAKLTLEACIILLEMSKEPLHYKMITQILVESGMIQPYGKSEFNQIVYSVMHQDVKKNGSNSKIKFMGRGIFCISDIEGIEYLELPEIKDNSKASEIKERKENYRKLNKDKKLEIIRENKYTCGNCKFIEFFASEEINMKRGACNNTCSGKSFVNSNSLACSEYIEMSEARKKSLIRTSEELRLVVIRTNIETINNRNRDKILT